MKTDIGTREIITVSIPGVTLQGTYHKREAEEGASRTGLIFLNGGYRPRSGEGDTGVYWADSLAACGYPCFRFDLPGYGDSGGNVPAKFFDWLHLVNTGVYGRLVADITHDVSDRFHRNGSVIVGHCAGGVSAIYAAAASSDIKGVVLLDPYFHCEREITTARTRLREWTTRNRVAGFISKTYDRLKYLDRLIGSERLPENANLQLIRCCEQLIARKLPILVLKAPALNDRVRSFDYPGYLGRMCGSDSPLTVELIEGTSHSFARGSGKASVRDRIEHWLANNFSGANDRMNSWKRPYALK